MATIHLLIECGGSYDTCYEKVLKAFFNEETANGEAFNLYLIERDQQIIAEQITDFYKQWEKDNRFPDDDFNEYWAKQEAALCQFVQQKWPHLNLDVDMNYGQYIMRDPIVYEIRECEIV